MPDSKKRDKQSFINVQIPCKLKERLDVQLERHGMTLKSVIGKLTEEVVQKLEASEPVL